MSIKWEEARRQTILTMEAIERKRNIQKYFDYGIMDGEEAWRMLDSDIDNRFNWHEVTEDTGMKHEAVRNNCKDLANLLNSILPEGREKSLAITHLEEVMMWANAAIARR